LYVAKKSSESLKENTNDINMLQFSKRGYR